MLAANADVARLNQFAERLGGIAVIPHKEGQDLMWVIRIRPVVLRFRGLRASGGDYDHVYVARAGDIEIAGFRNLTGSRGM